ncbi:MAG: LacI family transcriptional regulator [Anaerolineae bacterium]|nr:LacI family transcriptional regulator [Anaerolineae bacterium]
MSKPPSLRDVAEHAGVSLGTASRALNNKNNVLPDTRARVLKAASELGYKLQFRVHSAVASKLNTIGVIIKRDPIEYHGIDPFNYGLLCGIEDECKRLGMNMMFSTIPVDEYSHAVGSSPILAEAALDGLVIVGAILSDKALCDQLPTDIPIVFVDACAYHGEFDSVLIDNFGSAYQIVSHLIEQGHTTIGLIGSSSKSDEHPSIQERRRGYLQALADHGIDRTYIEDSSLMRQVASAAAQLLLTEHPEITALFACNDQLATDIIPLAHKLGRPVPESLSIVGFDDVDIAAKSMPPLTTMHVDRELMGALAVRRLYDRATYLDSVPVKVLVGTRLVMRQSVSAPVRTATSMSRVDGKSRRNS